MALARRELWRERAHLAAAWHQYLVLGFCGVLVCGAWVYLGAQTTVAMNIVLIFPGVYWVSRRQGLPGC